MSPRCPPISQKKSEQHVLTVYIHWWIRDETRALSLQKKQYPSTLSNSSLKVFYTIPIKFQLAFIPFHHHLLSGLYSFIPKHHHPNFLHIKLLRHRMAPISAGSSSGSYLLHEWFKVVTTLTMMLSLIVVLLPKSGKPTTCITTYLSWELFDASFCLLIVNLFFCSWHY